MVNVKTCLCHGEPMRWKKNPRRKAGGCWTCVVKIRAQERRYRRSHPEVISRVQRRWADSHRDHVLKKNRAYYQENAERLREYSRTYYVTNRDKVRASNRRWYEANPEKWREYERKRRTRKHAAGPQDYTDVEVFALTDGKCAYQTKVCTGTATNVDHIISLYNGGANRWGNVIGACVQCNSSKGTRDIAWIEKNAPWFLESRQRIGAW